MAWKTQFIEPKGMPSIFLIPSPYEIVPPNEENEIDIDPILNMDFPGMI